METRSKLNLNNITIQSLEFNYKPKPKPKRKNFKRDSDPLGNVLLFDTESTYFDVSEGNVDKR